MREKDFGKTEDAREVSLSKLNVLLDPLFKSFAVRFYNIEEYTKMLRERCFQGSEVSMYGLRPHQNFFGATFQDFLHTAAEQGWGDIASKCTAWPTSAYQAEFHADFRRIFREVMEGDLGNVPSQTLDDRMPELRRRLNSYISHFRAEFSYLKQIGILPDSADSIRNADDMHSLLRHIRDVPGRKGEESGKRQDAPYHVGAVFDPKALDISHGATADRTSHGILWYPFNKNHSQDGRLLLGGISLFDDDDLVQQLLQCPSSDDAWAHPLFDVRGNVLSPR